MFVKYKAKVIANEKDDLDHYLEEVTKDGESRIVSVTWLPRDAPDGPGYLVVSEHKD